MLRSIFRKKTKVYFSFFLSLLVTAIIYYPGIKGPLILDDIHNLQALKFLQSDVVGWIDILKMMPNGIDRPIPSLSFILDWKLYGDNVSGFKTTNIVIHLICGIFVYLIIFELLNNSSKLEKNKLAIISLWAASMWLMAPLYVSTVLYVVQRMAQLAALFVLMGLYFYILAYNCGRNEKSKQSFFFYFLSFFVCWPLALLSKENAILFPLLTLTITYFYLIGDFGWNKKILYLQLSFIAVILLVFVYLTIVHPGYLFGAYAVRDFTFYERLITQSRILFDYLGNLLILPGSSPYGLFHDDFIKSAGLLSPVISLVSIMALAVTVFISFLYRNPFVKKVLGGIIFFLAAHIVESSILPLEMYFEHRNYLPGVGIFLSLGFLTSYVLEYSKTKMTVVALLVFYLLIAVVLTSNRVAIWQSWNGIILQAEKSHPDSARTQMALAILYINNKKIDKAFTHLDRVSQLNTGKRDTGIVFTRMVAFCRENRMPTASVFNDLETINTITDDFYSLSAMQWLMENIEKNKCDRDIQSAIVTALDKKIGTDNISNRWGKAWDMYSYQARMLSAIELNDNALHRLQQAISLNPNLVDLRLLEIRYLLDYKKYDLALSRIKIASEQYTDMQYYQKKLFDIYKKELEIKYR